MALVSGFVGDLLVWASGFWTSGFRFLWLHGFELEGLGFRVSVSFRA